MTIYACPVCKRHLHQEQETLCCSTCSHAYPIKEDIPDFLGEELSQSKDPELRRMRFIDRMARIYETKLWYPLVLNVYGGFSCDEAWGGPFGIHFYRRSQGDSAISQYA